MADKPVESVRFHKATKPSRPPQGVVEFKVDPSTGVLAQLNPDGTFTALGASVGTPSASATIEIITDESYTLTPEDNGKVFYMDRGTAITVVVPFGLGAGFNAAFIQANTGTVSFAADDEVVLGSLDDAASISGRYGAASIVFISDTVANLSGSLA